MPYRRQLGANERGYGAQHRRNSQHVTTARYCARCGGPFTPNDPLVRGHILDKINGGTNTPGNYQAEHRSCNSRAGAQVANARRRATRTANNSRHW